MPGSKPTSHKQRFDRNHPRQVDYPINSFVWAYKPKIGDKAVFNLAKLFDGPYRVDAKLSNRTYRLVHVITGEPRLAHADNIRSIVQLMNSVQRKL